MLRFIDQPDDNYSADQVAGLNLRGLYQQADKALGGWLPGGGTANPLSKPARQLIETVTKPPIAELNPPEKPYTRLQNTKATPQSPALTPQGQLTPEAKQVLGQLGITANVTNKLSETNPLAQIGAELGYLNAAHANPFKNQIYIPNSNLNTLTTLAHEAGHLDRVRRKGGRPPLEGVFGQAINMPAAAVKQGTGGELSPFAQLLAPLRILGGGLTAYSDAHEEDHAEKYAHEAMNQMFGVDVPGAVGSAGNASTASQYSQNLHGDGLYSMGEGLMDLLIPAPVKALGALVSEVSKATAPKEKAGPALLNPGVSKQQMQMLLVEADVNLKYELQQNPNSRLIPRLRQIRDQYAKQLAALQ